MHTIMLVDDEASILQALRRVLRIVPCSFASQVFNLEVVAFSSPISALDYAQHHGVDLFLTDYRMPEMDGITFLKHASKVHPDACRLVLSGYADLNALSRAINEVGIDRFVAKPWKDYELVAAIAQCLAHRELLLENRRLADLMRLDMGDISPVEAEARRLEKLEPGITKVHWGPDGSVVLDPEALKEEDLS